MSFNTFGRIFTFTTWGESHGPALGATGILMEIGSGEILAMASLPDFDPNDRPRPLLKGDPSDSPDAETVCGLGNRKNDAFNAVLERDGVTAYEGSVRLLDALEANGVRLAVVSSSQNAAAVLAALAGSAAGAPVPGG